MFSLVAGLTGSTEATKNVPTSYLSFISNQPDVMTDLRF